MTADRQSPRVACPDAEQLALYAEGGLSAKERLAIEEHLVGCEDCRTVLAETMAFVETAGSIAADGKVLPFLSRRWVKGVAAGLAAAAALVLVVRVARPGWLGLGGASDRPELQELVAAMANEPTRPVEGRLTGGFKYAPSPSPTRGPGDRDVSPEVRIAAAKIEKLAGAEDTPANRAALGVAYAVLGDLDKAVGELERAVDQAPGNAQYLSDLSAVYLARARRLDKADEYPKALTAAERAIQANPNLAEGWFNRALSLEELKQRNEALKAWNDCLRVDSGSLWTEEVRKHMQTLETGRPSGSVAPRAESDLARSTDDEEKPRRLTERPRQTAREDLDRQVLERDSSWLDEGDRIRGLTARLRQ